MVELLELKLQKEKQPRKKLDRTIYIALTDAMGWSLCGFCRYSSGGCQWQECEHPLADSLPSVDEELSPGCDCWGFKPVKRMSISDFADVAGTYLEQGWEVCSFDKSVNGKIIMIGAKDWY